MPRPKLLTPKLSLHISIDASLALLIRERAKLEKKSISVVVERLIEMGVAGEGLIVLSEFED